MSINTPARAPVRALVGAAAFGSLVGLAMGCAYLGGTMAKAMTVQAKAERLAGTQKAGLSDQRVLAASGVDGSARLIANRLDPYSVAGFAERDRQSTLSAEHIAERDPTLLRSAALAAGLRKADFAATPAAAPYRYGQALEASRDLDCLTSAVYYEARGEGAAGMQAVAQVVLNRVRHPAFPKSVCSVVYQGAGSGTCQFSFACDGSTRQHSESEAWRRARQIASKALSGWVMAEVGNATHFHTTAVSPNWRSNLARIAQVGSHVFYRFGGSSGAPDAFRYTPKPSSGGMDAGLARPVIAGFAPNLGPGDGPKPYQILFKGAEAAAPAKAEDKPAAKAEAPAEPAKAETTPAS